VVNLPYNSLGALFKGRDAALIDLKQRLGSGHCQAIHGLGGVGKTRLAVEYAWRYAGDYTALLFASALSAVDLRTNLAAFCEPMMLELPELGRRKEAASLSAVFGWLSENPGWLLILDNADTQEAAAEVEKTLPQLQRGQVLITTRLADWSPAVQIATEPLDSVAQRLNNLAGLYYTLGRYTEAEALLSQALEIDQKCYGPEHPNIARDLNNLAALSKSTNRLSEAESLMRRSAVILLKFAHSIGYLHPQLRATLRDYYVLLTELALGQEEILRLTTGLGRDAGFRWEDHRELIDRIFE
jgi:tetratricopeptide (TPR) repeat protein